MIGKENTRKAIATDLKRLAMLVRMTVDGGEDKEELLKFVSEEGNRQFERFMNMSDKMFVFEVLKDMFEMGQELHVEIRHDDDK